MRIKLFCCLIFFPFLCLGQKPVTGADSARRLIDTALSYARQNSLYSKNVNFKLVADSVKLTSKDAATIKDAMPAIALMYKMLGDYHGAAYYQGKPYKWNISKAAIDKEKYKDLITKYWKGKPALETRMLEKGYGYICIPANNPTHAGESRAIATQIQNSLMKLKPATLKGIVVDLRLNTGGSLWPMALGVGNLFSSGKLGMFVFPKASMNESWSIVDTVFYTNSNKEGSVAVLGKVNPKIKIAILTSPYTASSAEALAISFKGQKNASIIGDATAGYTSANDGFTFYGVQFLMANAVEADRSGHVYYDNVAPDLEVRAGDNFNDFSKDAKIIAALKWLKGK